MKEFEELYDSLDESERKQISVKAFKRLRANALLSGLVDTGPTWVSDCAKAGVWNKQKG